VRSSSWLAASLVRVPISWVTFMTLSVTSSVAEAVRISISSVALASRAAANSAAAWVRVSIASSPYPPSWRRTRPPCRARPDLVSDALDRGRGEFRGGMRAGLDVQGEFSTRSVV